MTQRGWRHFDSILKQWTFVPFDCVRCRSAPAIWKCGLCDDCFPFLVSGKERG